MKVNENHSNILIILNSPIYSTKVLRHLWSLATCIIVADGGANSLWDTFTGNDRDTYIPNFIVVMMEIYLMRL